MRSLAEGDRYDAEQAVFSSSAVPLTRRLRQMRKDPLLNVPADHHVGLLPALMKTDRAVSITAVRCVVDRH